MLIDMHGHVSAPPELQAYHALLLASRGAHGRGKVNVSDERIEQVLNSPTFGPKSHLEHLKSGQIDLQFISPRPFSQQMWKQPEKLVHWFAEETNNIIGRQCKLHPDIFRGVAGLPQSPGVSPKNCLQELERTVKELGFVGCLINPDPGERGGDETPGMGDEYWYPLYEKLVELDVPGLVHTASCQSSRLTYSLHFINEESIAIISLLSSKVFQDFPTLKIVVSHGGGAIPYQMGRFMAARYMRGGERFEEAIRKLHFDTCVYTKDGLDLLFRVVGVDRCMYGTEKPGTGTAIHPDTGKSLDDLKPVIESIEWLSDADRKAIFEENTKKLFNLKLN